MFNHWFKIEINSQNVQDISEIKIYVFNQTLYHRQDVLVDLLLYWLPNQG